MELLFFVALFFVLVLAKIYGWGIIIVSVVTLLSIITFLILYKRGKYNGLVQQLKDCINKNFDDTFIAYEMLESMKFDKNYNVLDNSLWEEEKQDIIESVIKSTSLSDECYSIAEQINNYHQEDNPFEIDFNGEMIMPKIESKYNEMLEGRKLSIKSTKDYIISNVKEHIQTLTRKRKQLIQKGDYDLVDDTKWVKEKIKFLTDVCIVDKDEIEQFELLDFLEKQIDIYTIGSYENIGFDDSMDE